MTVKVAVPPENLQACVAHPANSFAPGTPSARFKATLARNNFDENGASTQVETIRPSEVMIVASDDFGAAYLSPY
jgi:hypothetical protein